MSLKGLAIVQVDDKPLIAPDILPILETNDARGPKPVRPFRDIERLFGPDATAAPRRARPQACEKGRSRYPFHGMSKRERCPRAMTSGFPH